MKLKKGDTVIVLSGKDKGKSGEILRVIADRVDARGLAQPQVIVSGVNVRTIHRKPTREKAGAIIKEERPVHYSTVAFSEGGKAVRVGYKVDGDKKVRISRKTGKAL